MARLYSNENFPLPVVEELRRLGHDVLTIQETAQAGQSLSDDVVLAFACAERRMLLTLNRKHFLFACIFSSMSIVALSLVRWMWILRVWPDGFMRRLKPKRKPQGR